VDVHGRCEPQVARLGTRELLRDWRKLAVGGRDALFGLLFWASKKVTNDSRDSCIFYWIFSKKTNKGFYINHILILQ